MSNEEILTFTQANPYDGYEELHRSQLLSIPEEQDPMLMIEAKDAVMEIIERGEQSRALAYEQPAYTEKLAIHMAAVAIKAYGLSVLIIDAEKASKTGIHIEAACQKINEFRRLPAALILLHMNTTNSSEVLPISEALADISLSNQKNTHFVGAILPVPEARAVTIDQDSPLMARTTV